MKNREIAKILLIESLDMDCADYVDTLKAGLDDMENTLKAIEGTNLYEVLNTICESKDNVLNSGFCKHIMQEIGEE